MKLSVLCEVLCEEYSRPLPEHQMIPIVDWFIGRLKAIKKKFEIDSNPPKEWFHKNRLNLKLNVGKHLVSFNILIKIDDKEHYFQTKGNYQRPDKIKIIVQFDKENIVKKMDKILSGQTRIVFNFKTAIQHEISHFEADMSGHLIDGAKCPENYCGSKSEKSEYSKYRHSLPEIDALITQLIDIYRRSLAITRRSASSSKPPKETAAYLMNQDESGKPQISPLEDHLNFLGHKTNPSFVQSIRKRLSEEGIDWKN